MKHQKIYNRLRRIEGQIRGIEEMVSKDRPEQDIIIQLEAAGASLSSTTESLIKEMLKSEGGKVVIEKEQADLILKYIKK